MKWLLILYLLGTHNVLQPAKYNDETSCRLAGYYAQNHYGRTVAFGVRSFGVDGFTCIPVMQ